MQLSMNRRMSDGMQFTVAYTLREDHRLVERNTNPNQTIPIPEFYDLNKAETGRPHRLNTSLVYELPFGSGKKWLNDGGVLGARRGRLAAEHLLQLCRQAHSSR